MNVATRGEDNGRKLRKLLRNAERGRMNPLAYLCSLQVRICPYELRRSEDVGRDLNRTSSQLGTGVERKTVQIA